jgi:hypothetical protein
VTVPAAPRPAVDPFDPVRRSPSVAGGDPEPDGGAPPRRSARWAEVAPPSPGEVAVLAVAFVAGVVQRWWVLAGPLGYVDLDEAAVGIQAQRFGSHPQAFFPGQDYGGTLETSLVAVVQKVFGTGPLPLKASALLLHLLACVLVWRAAQRVVPSRLGRLAAPVLLWCGPAAGVWESTKERGFYGASIVLVAALVLVAARLDERPTRADAVAFGLLVGLGWWTTPLVMLAAVPATGWLLVRRPGLWRLVVPVGAAAVVGALPWILSNVADGGGSLLQPADFGSDFGSRLGDGLAKLSVLIGLETPWHDERALVPAARVVAVVVVVVAVVVGGLRSRARAPGLVAAVVVGYLALYPSANSAGSVGPDPRYLYLLLPPLALALASLLPDPRPPADDLLLVEPGGSAPSDGPGPELAAFDPVPASGLSGLVTRPDGSIPSGAVLSASPSASAPWLLLAATVVVVAMAAWGLVGMDAVRDTDVRFLHAPGTNEVIDLLEARNVRVATTDLLGTQITYATDGRIRASSFAVPRFDDLERAALVRRPSTYVLQRGLFGNVDRFERWLTERGVGFERVDRGVWVVLFLDRWVPPWEPNLSMFGIVVKPPT